MKLFNKFFSSLAVVVLAAATMFAQDGRTKVNFYNQTSSNLRFMLNSRPACTGDVIPGGYCTESVNPGNYTASATNGRYTSGGKNFDIADGGTFNYYVSEESSSNAASNDVHYQTVADLDYHTGFTVNAPVTLKTAGPTQSTTNAGKTFTEIIYSAEMPNTDAYLVGVFQYPFQVADSDLALALEGFRKSMGGTVINQSPTTVSNQPALIADVESTTDGRTLRFAVEITYRGNKAFMFAFGTYMDVAGTNSDEVKTFFRSARLN